MAQIRIDLAEPLLDGMDIKFKAPCHCNEVTGLKVYYPQGETTATKEFTFRDTHGNDLTGLGNLFFEGSYVKVIVDAENGFAYLQNADTNGYLETKLSMELLWRNGNTGSEFGEQTVTFDAGQCDYLIFNFYATSSLASVIPVAFVPVSGKQIIVQYYSMTAKMMINRSFTPTKNSSTNIVSVSFADTSGDVTSKNGYLKPKDIYGIKGGAV